MNHPTFVEFHDATLRSFTAAATGLVSLDFAYACAYFEVEQERYAVRAFEVMLDCLDVTKLTLTGPWQRDDYVSDAALDGVPIGPAETEVLLRGAGGSTLSFQFGSGLLLRVTAGAFQVHLKREVRELKDWVGPLRSRT